MQLSHGILVVALLISRVNYGVGYQQQTKTQEPSLLESMIQMEQPIYDYLDSPGVVPDNDREPKSYQRTTPVKFKHYRKRRTTTEMHGRGIYSPTSKMNQYSAKTGTKTKLFKCTFVGNLGIKNSCTQYHMCPRVGAYASTKICPGSKMFDFILRTCIKNEQVRCNSAAVCPNNNVFYLDLHDDQVILQCISGVPFPRQRPQLKE